MGTTCVSKKQPDKSVDVIATGELRGPHHSPHVQQDAKLFNGHEHEQGDEIKRVETGISDMSEPAARLIPYSDDDPLEEKVRKIQLRWRMNRKNIIEYMRLLKFDHILQCSIAVHLSLDEEYEHESIEELMLSLYHNELDKSMFCQYWMMGQHISSKQVIERHLALMFKFQKWKIAEQLSYVNESDLQLFEMCDPVVHSRTVIKDHITQGDILVVLKPRWQEPFNAMAEQENGTSALQKQMVNVHSYTPVHHRSQQQQQQPQLHQQPLSHNNDNIAGGNSNNLRLYKPRESAAAPNNNNNNGNKKKTSFKLKLFQITSASDELFDSSSAAFAQPNVYSDEEPSPSPNNHASATVDYTVLQFKLEHIQKYITLQAICVAVTIAERELLMLRTHSNLQASTLAAEHKQVGDVMSIEHVQRAKNKKLTDLQEDESAEPAVIHHDDKPRHHRFYFTLSMARTNAWITVNKLVNEINSHFDNLSFLYAIVVQAMHANASDPLQYIEHVKLQNKHHLLSMSAMPEAARIYICAGMAKYWSDIDDTRSIMKRIQSALEYSATGSVFMYPKDYAARTKWKVGDPVMVLNQDAGKWCPGQIMQCSANKEDIEVKGAVLPDSVAEELASPSSATAAMTGFGFNSVQFIQATLDEDEHEQMHDAEDSEHEEEEEEEDEKEMMMEDDDNGQRVTLRVNSVPVNFNVDNNNADKPPEDIDDTGMNIDIGVDDEDDGLGELKVFSTKHKPRKKVTFTSDVSTVGDIPDVFSETVGDITDGFDGDDDRPVVTRMDSTNSRIDVMSRRKYENIDFSNDLSLFAVTVSRFDRELVRPMVVKAMRRLESISMLSENGIFNFNAAVKTGAELLDMETGLGNGVRLNNRLEHICDDQVMAGMAELADNASIIESVVAHDNHHHNSNSNSNHIHTNSHVLNATNIHPATLMLVEVDQLSSKINLENRQSEMKRRAEEEYADEEYDSELIMTKVAKLVDSLGKHFNEHFNSNNLNVNHANSDLVSTLESEPHTDSYTHRISVHESGKKGTTIKSEAFRFAHNIFAVILHNTDVAKSLMISRFLQKQIADLCRATTHFRYDEHYLTVSMAIATLHYNENATPPTIVDSARSWYKRCYNALKTIRYEGGNGVTHADVLFGVRNQSSSMPSMKDAADPLEQKQQQQIGAGIIHTVGSKASDPGLARAFRGSLDNHQHNFAEFQQVDDDDDDEYCGNHLPQPQMQQKNLSIQSLCSPSYEPVPTNVSPTGNPMSPQQLLPSSLDANNVDNIASPSNNTAEDWHRAHSKTVTWVTGRVDRKYTFV